MVGPYAYHLEGLRVPQFGNHWDRWTNYENLTAFKINTGIECADALNSFNGDLWDRKIDKLVDEAIKLDLLEFDETIVNVITTEKTKLNTPEIEMIDLWQ